MYVLRRGHVRYSALWFQCFDLVEQYEDDIEDWYWGHQEVPLVDYLCRNRVLKEQDHGTDTHTHTHTHTHWAPV